MSTCDCCASRNRPHPSRDNAPDCTWCGRPQGHTLHDPRRGRALGALIKADAS